jgi:hypothetical protein
LVKINEHAFWPEGQPKLFAADDLAGTFQENNKGAKGHLLDPDLDAAPAKLPRAEIGLKHAKPNHTGDTLRGVHKLGCVGDLQFNIGIYAMR